MSCNPSYLTSSQPWDIHTDDLWWVAHHICISFVGCFKFLLIIFLYSEGGSSERVKEVAAINYVSIRYHYAFEMHWFHLPTSATLKIDLAAAKVIIQDLKSFNVSCLHAKLAFCPFLPSWLTIQIMCARNFLFPPPCPLKGLNYLENSDKSNSLLLARLLL